MEESRTEKWLREKFGRGLMDIAMVIGIVFGLLPAVKASNLNPIQALRRD